MHEATEATGKCRVKRCQCDSHGISGNFSAFIYRLFCKDVFPFFSKKGVDICKGDIYSQTSVKRALKGPQILWSLKTGGLLTQVSYTSGTLKRAVS